MYARRYSSCTLFVSALLSVSIGNASPASDTFFYLQAQKSFPVPNNFLEFSAILTAISPNDVYLQISSFDSTTNSTRLQQYTFLNEGLAASIAGAGIVSFDFDEAAQTAGAVFQLDVADNSFLCAALTSLSELQNDMSSLKSVLGYGFGTPPQCTLKSSNATVKSALMSRNIAVFAILNESELVWGGVSNALQQWTFSMTVVPGSVFLDDVAGNANLGLIAFHTNAGDPFIQTVVPESGSVQNGQEYPLLLPDNAAELLTIEISLDANNILYVLYLSNGFSQLDVYQLFTNSAPSFIATSAPGTGPFTQAPFLKVNKRGVAAYVFSHLPARCGLLNAGVSVSSSTLGKSTSSVISAGINQVDTGLAVLYGDAVGGLFAQFQCGASPVRVERNIQKFNVDPVHPEVDVIHTGLAAISNKCDFKGHGAFFGIPFTSVYELFVIAQPPPGSFRLNRSPHRRKGHHK